MAIKHPRTLFRNPFFYRVSVLLALVFCCLSLILLTGCSSVTPTDSKPEASPALDVSSDGSSNDSSDGSSTSGGSSTPAKESEVTNSEAEVTLEPVSLTVFAAASMTETLSEIATLYQKENPHITFHFNFDSSGTLKTQIEEGAECDIFISAAEKQMNQLDITASKEANPDSLDFLEPETRFRFVENKVVLAVPEGNPANIQSFQDIGTETCQLIALGNEDVPVGAYSIEILEHLGILDELSASGKITYGSNVKEVTTQISEAAVDCGIIYATDAFSAGLTVVDTATSDMCRQVIYPAAVLNISSHKEEARAFLDYLTTKEARAILEAVGFSMAE